MKKKRPSVGSLSMQNYPNKSAGTIYINPSPPVPSPPVNIELPLLSGTGAVDTIVTCSSGVWTGSPAPTYTYIFYVDGIEEQNSSSNEFFVHVSYDGLTITAEVTATNTEGSATEPASNSIVVGTIPVNTVEPTLSPSGIQSTGTLITINERTWDGTPPLTFEYRWLRDGIVIDGEDGKTYTIAVEDDGTVITAEVRASNAYGVSIWVLTSNQVDAVNAVAPSNVTAPVISGSTSLGSVLSTTNGTWSGTPSVFSYTYQWKRNGSNIVGATSSTYVTVLADSLANITCDVTASNGVAPDATAGSNTLTMADYKPANTVAPVISGTAVVGQTLSTTNGTWTNSPSSYSYQWYRGVNPISGATNSTYTPIQADAGNTSNIKCVVTATNGAGSASADSNTVAQVLTVRTSAFITANTAADTSTIRAALNDLDIGLIANSIDTRARGIYPFVGGTASAHKWNFMDARDLDAAFRLMFSGTWTHSSTGALPNGTNAFADPYFIPSVNASTNGIGHGIYSRTESVAGTRIYGCVIGGVTILQNNISGGNFVSGNVSNNIISYTASPTTRLLYNRRNSTTDMQAYRDGTSLGTNTNACASLPSSKFYFGARNGGSGTPDFYDNHEIAFAILDIGLTNAQALALRTLVNNFQLALGRNV